MPHPPAVSPAIPDYQLLTLIGRGSYGDVWLARGITGAHCAIKVIWRARFQDEQTYLSELRGLRHFAAISLIEDGQLALLHVGHNETEGYLYYVMEAADDASGGAIAPETYVPNTLAEALRRRGRICPSQALAIAAALAHALAGLHARGLVHRDIKPSNIIFVAGRAKLADIGTIGIITTEQTVAGTPGYAPPEGPGTTAADVFSLGKVIYEIAMGLDRRDFPRLPHGFETWPDRILLLELNEIIVQACDPSPARRHPDASSLLDEIRGLKAGQSVRQKRRRKQTLLTGGLGLITATAVLVGAALIPYAVRERRRRPREAYQNALNRAALALELNDPARAREELLAVRPTSPASDPRGFEWYALWNDAVIRIRSSRTGLTPATDRRPALCVSGDGSRLAVTGPGPSLNLVSVGSLLPVAAVETGAQPAGFLRDDSVLAWSEAGTVHTWRSAEGLREVARLGMGRGVRLLTLALDGSLFAAAGVDGDLEIWDAQGPKLRHAIRAHPDRRITGLAVSQRGELVATADEAGRLRIWNAATGVSQANVLSAAGVRTMAFGPDAAHLALVLESGMLELRRTPDLEMVNRARGGRYGIHALSFDPNGRRLIAGDATGGLTVYDTTDWSEVVRLPTGDTHSPIQSLAFSSDGQVLAAQLADGSFTVWMLTRDTP
jgi:serine/threonine protein kinase